MSKGNISVTTVPGDTLLVSLSGDWKLGAVLPATAELPGDPAAASVKHVAFDTSLLREWDSSLLTCVARIADFCRREGISLDPAGLPEGVRILLELASPEHQRSGVSRGTQRPPFLERVANRSFDLLGGMKELVAFIGEVTLALMGMLRGKANFRRVDLIVALQETGAQALPIVTLISLLVGMILAFVAAIQLKLFGAQIFVADVVGIGIFRVMGAVMTGIIMAGRTGAAFAAQLGTMQVNEEIDALETLGISSAGFLVLPRIVALTLMMPLLCIYADFMGVAGGMIVGVGMLDLGVMEYLNQTKAALSLTHFLIGLFHSLVFGILVGIAGCLRGIQCGRNASAVGYAATSAVVTSIVWMVLATAVITLCCQVLGI